MDAMKGGQNHVHAIIHAASGGDLTAQPIRCYLGGIDPGLGALPSRNGAETDAAGNLVRSQNTEL